MNKKKLFNVFTFLSACVLLLTSCNKEPVVGPQGEQGIPGEVGPQGPKGDTGQDGVSVVSIELTDTDGNVDTYTITYSNGKTSTFLVINGINGQQGIQGVPGEDGHSPIVTIGDNGNWFIDGVDTGVKAQGPKGDKGDDGLTPYIGDNGNWWIGEVDTGVRAGGTDGVSITNIELIHSENGVDTYRISFSNGTTFDFVVTNGEKGDKGDTGNDGTSVLTGHGVPTSELGKLGDSYIDLDTWNYYVKELSGWVKKGNIKGEPGTDGSNGENGTNGKSAYEIYCEAHPEYTGDEAQWLDDLINGRLGNKQIHTVTFNTNGGTSVETQFVLHGEKAVKPVNPTKEYCIFTDWVDENDDHWVFNGFSITSDITLNAVWKDQYNYGSIIINEICSKSRKSFVDKYGEESDWIELYNSGAGDIDLKGCGLSKSTDNPYALTFDNYILEGGSYLVVAASGRPNKLFENEYHAPFTLSNKKAGTLYFSSPFEIKSSINYPALKDDISFGVLGNDLTMLKPSAGRNNEEVYLEKQILPAPTFSKKSGIYDSEFDLMLTSSEGYHIYYTVDSETPTESSTLYDNPIHIYDKTSEANVLSARTDICGSRIPYTPTNPVNKCMVVRAICYDDNGNYSPVVSSSYWIEQNDFIQSGVSVMSISTDFDNLFDDEKGIYCRGKTWDDWVASSDYNPDLSYWDQPGNYQQKGFDWERMVNITYLNEKHNVKCEQLAGIRIKGSSTRGNPKKSFNLYSRFLYDGNSKFDYKFNDKKCEGITLRSGGNNTDFMVTDPINSMIAKKYNLNMETQDSTPTYLFLNGEYWGLYFITDKYDSRFLEEKYGIDDSIIWKAGEIEEGYQTDISYFEEARATINSSLLTEEGFANFASKYSVSSFVDTLIFHSYIDHYDYNLFWSNTSAWRSREVDESIEKADGLIRFMLYDTDFSLGTHFDYTHYPKLFDSLKNSSTLKFLLESPQLVALIKSRSSELAELLASQECIDMVTDYFEKVEPLIQQNNIRYFGSVGTEYLNKWNTLIEYLENRPSYYLTFVEEL